MDAQVTKVWVSVTRNKHRQFSVVASENELQLKLTKVMRSRGLSVTLLMLENNSGSVARELRQADNNVDLVVSTVQKSAWID